MIQSKNKFLPILYIRKCKITYLECLLLSRRMAATGSYSLLRKHDMTAAQHTRMLEDTGGYMDGWMDGWADARTDKLLQRSGRSPARYSQREDADHAKVEVHAENTCCSTNLHGTQEDSQRTISLGTWVYAYVWVMCEFRIRSKKKRNPTEQNSCPQHQLPEEKLSWGFWFPPSSHGSCVGRFKGFIPYNCTSRRGVTSKELHTDTHIFKSLSNTSATGLGGPRFMDTRRTPLLKSVE